MNTTYRVTARNFAVASENRIHEDSVAKAHGFKGGLVPGVTTWAYMTHPVVETFGPAWLARGTMTAKFTKPVYEGDVIEIGAATHDDVLELTATNEAGVVVAVGTAVLPAMGRHDVDLASHPLAPLPAPDARPDATAERLAAGTVLGTLELGFHADRHPEFLAEIDDDLPLWRAERIAHPGFLMRQANFVLAQNVRLGPWVHLESITHHLGVVPDGSRVAVRGTVAREFERKGNRLVELDVLYVVDGTTPVLHVRHTAIWKLRPS
ncbi:MAG TPA: hypothetical protein VM030_11190 [Acidimicrobiales bacterium]|nr:hypothetical protein [Acidimicrobiales bacterium]